MSSANFKLHGLYFEVILVLDHNLCRGRYWLMCPSLTKRSKKYFKDLQLSVVWPCVLWYSQCLVVSLLPSSVHMGAGGVKKGFPLISFRISSLGMLNTVKLGSGRLSLLSGGPGGGNANRVLSTMGIVVVFSAGFSDLVVVICSLNLCAGSYVRW